MHMEDCVILKGSLLPPCCRLRNTTKVNRYTNEKVGTAGTPTGMDSTLVAYQSAK